MARGKIILDKSYLIELYIDKSLSPYIISKKFKCSPSTITNRLKEFGIPLKSPALARTRYSKSDFSGNLEEKAYMTGFRIGDLNVYKVSNSSNCIVVRCHTTQREQVYVIEHMFKKYGKVTVSENKGHFHINCFLNLSFDFLLNKDEFSWEWVKKSGDRVKFSFMAGYTDAEGNFILNQNRARFKIDSYDFEVLSWISQWLIEKDINNRFRCIYRKGERVRGYAYSFKKDLWRLNVNDAVSLKLFIGNISPFLRHQLRITDAEISLRNINDRENRKNKKLLYSGAR